MMTTSISPSREQALAELERFVPKLADRYSRERDLDLGSSDRGNVSQLSAYLAHRLITESEVANSVLLAHKAKLAESFLSALVKRTYWKGWLEGRPQVYSSWLRLRAEDGVRWPERQEYQAAVKGETGIEVFDAWVTELLETGYLHHQARLNFASIWIFTLKLPWSLGADFFLQNLLDGDVASNTLSWRWVAGLQAKGKHYVATADKIKAFTKDRFHPEGDFSEAPRSLSGPADPGYQVPVNFPFKVSEQVGEDYAILLTGDDLSAELGYLGELKPKLILALDTQEVCQELTFSKKVGDFKKAAMTDAAERASAHFNCEAKILSLGGNATEALSERMKASRLTSLAYYEPSVGPWKDRTTAMTSKDVGVRFFPLRRPWDGLLHPHCEKSLVHFKKHSLPQIMRTKGMFRKSSI